MRGKRHGAASCSNHGDAVGRQCVCELDLRNRVAKVCTGGKGRVLDGRKGRRKERTSK